MLDVPSEEGGTPRSAKSGKNLLLLPTLRDSRLSLKKQAKETYLTLFNAEFPKLPDPLPRYPRDYTVIYEGTSVTCSDPESSKSSLLSLACVA